MQGAASTNGAEEMGSGQTKKGARKGVSPRSWGCRLAVRPAPGLGIPWCAPFEPVHCSEAFADLADKTAERSMDPGVEVGAAGAVRAVEHLIDHGDHLLQRARG